MTVAETPNHKSQYQGVYQGGGAKDFSGMCFWAGGRYFSNAEKCGVNGVFTARNGKGESFSVKNIQILIRKKGGGTEAFFG